jgi:hypothetical protein
VQQQLWAQAQLGGTFDSIKKYLGSLDQHYAWLSKIEFLVPLLLLPRLPVAVCRPYRSGRAVFG